MDKITGMKTKKKNFLFCLFVESSNRFENDVTMTHGCFWRENDEPEKLSRYYQTCSPDLNACPDRFCDPLEIIFPKSCPQDCTGKKLFKILDRRVPVFFFLENE